MLNLIVLFLFTAALIPGQGARHTYHRRVKPRRPSATLRIRSTAELTRLVKNLRTQGATVALTSEKVSQPFFSGASRIMNVNGQAVQVNQYAKASKLDREASRVSSNGMTIGTSKPSWLSTPHFYKTDKLIVLYVGDDQTILRILQSALGKQFAGG